MIYYIVYILLLVLGMCLHFLERRYVYSSGCCQSSTITSFIMMVTLFPILLGFLSFHVGFDFIKGISLIIYFPLAFRLIILVNRFGEYYYRRKNK